MKYVKLPDIIFIRANLEDCLVDAQAGYETAIKEYIRFKEAEIDAAIVYEKKLAEEIMRLKQEKTYATYTKEIARSYCHEEYKTMKHLEAKKEHYKAYISAWESRINMIKMLARIKYKELGGDV